MAKNLYTTANGRVLNMDQMRLLNEKTIAVGNMGVNARGDQVAPDGSIIKTRNEVMKERRNLSPVVRYNGHQGVAAPLQVTETPTVAPTEVKAPVPEASTNLRGSLASTVGVDLTNSVEVPKKTITRI
jgi:hypothetical protein